MGKRVGIIAVAQTRYEAYKPLPHLQELAYEPVKKVLQESGLKFTEDGTGIDATVSCSSDHWDGWTISSKNVVDVAGGHLRTEEKVAEDGAYALYYAIMPILAGHDDCVLLVAHTKEGQVEDGRLIENMNFDPTYCRMLGFDFLNAGAMQARRYMYKYGITAEQCAMVAVKNKGNGKKNPNVYASANLKLEDVLSSRVVSSPIRELEVKPVADGACAMIIAEESKAKKWCKNPVWINGIGSCYDTYFLGDRDLAECKSLESAASMAYKMAGISDPVKEINVVELSEYYSYQELLWTEGLGFCGRGGGGKLIESGATQIKGRLPVNPSGGLLCGIPVNVAGLNRVIEACLQIWGEAGRYQVSDAKTAVAHGTGGACGQMHCVIVLSKD